ncbi:MAG: Ribosomal RNA small subunit methyltransferase E [Verrucomicrobiae bacterium]|nr:Ribosomal RNA small subunit methyltransferase E [Verrucomicrobiae bacterium]
MHRFYLPNFQQPALSTAETHHATHVLRLKSGDIVNVFDGRGHEAQCRFNEAGKLTILQQTQTLPLPCRITLAQAVPKKNMDLIVEKATELGVATIIPLLSERTIVRLDENAGKLDRWREIALESCKQCGNNWLPVIEPPRKVPAFLAGTGASDLKLIASLQPGAQPLKTILGPTRPRSVLILIGPEGDFTPAEISSAKNAGCLPLSLGPLVLRAETAAIYTLSILHHELQLA